MDMWLCSPTADASKPRRPISNGLARVILRALLARAAILEDVHFNITAPVSIFAVVKGSQVRLISFRSKTLSSEITSGGPPCIYHHIPRRHVLLKWLTERTMSAVSHQLTIVDKRTL